MLKKKEKPANPVAVPIPEPVEYEYPEQEEHLTPGIISVRAAVERLKQALKEDEGYRMSWGANIAQSFIDAFGKITAAPLTKDRLYKAANDGASRFLDSLMR